MAHNVNTRANFKDLFESFMKEKTKVKVTLSVVLLNGPATTPPTLPMRVSGEVLACAEDYVSIKNDAGRVYHVSFGAIVYVEDAD